MNLINKIAHRPKAQPRSPDIDIGKFHFLFSKRTYVMGVLNITPDSFSDGGSFYKKEDALRRAVALAEDGADIIDVGGESTRPGAKDVGIDEETERVMPVIEEIKKAVDIPISIDTRKSEVAEAAIKAGAVIVNDVSGLTFDNAMAGLIARHQVMTIIMHSKGTPQTMQINPVYKDLIGEIIGRLKRSIDIAKEAGVREERIAVDPGIGFGKTADDNLKIINNIERFKILGRPVCVGTSRKSFIGKALGLTEMKDRLSGTLATSIIAIMGGARLIRTHDVKEMVQAAHITDAVMREAL